MSKRNLPRLVYGIVTLFIIAFYAGTILYQMDIEGIYNEDQQDELELVTDEILNGYELASRVAYDQITNEPGLLALYSQATDADEAQRAEIRAELLDVLGPTFASLQEINVRQLHFHLPDNTSFLRFHRPERFGDDLTDVRYTVRTVNETQAPVFGFEEGRIFNGFRYVFPLFYEGEHIGSVETSISFVGIQAELERVRGGTSTFVLRADVVDETVFDDEQSNYTPTTLSPSYLYDNETLERLQNNTDDDFGFARIEAINERIANQAGSEMFEGKPINIYLIEDGEHYIVTLLPILNARGQQVAYVVNYQIDDYLQSERIATVATLGVSTIGFIVLMWVLRNFFRTERLAVAQRDQLQTQNTELNALNTALTILNTDLEKAKTDAEQANQLKSEFLANMSHELRTPLNAIIGYTQLQLSGMVGDISDKAKSFQERTLLNAKDLLKLINDLLDVSKIEAGRMELLVQPFDLVALVNEVEEQNSVLASNKGLTFTVFKDEHLPHEIVGDATRIKQIMTNLLSNAIKFTNEGSVELHVEKASDNMWRINVKDTGIGIPPHLHEVIFDEFRQVEATVNKQEEGTGLGLAIVRRLVVMMGGYIRLQSEPGQGSTFTVLLPIEIGSSQTKTREEPNVVPK